MADLSAILNEQMEKEAQLNNEIKDQLSNIGIDLDKNELDQEQGGSGHVGTLKF